MGVVGLIVSAFIAVGTELINYWQDIAIASLVVLFFIAAGNTLNDYIDRDVDRIAHPQRPIPSGRVKAETALGLAVGAFVFSLAISFFLSPEATAVVIIAIALMLAYEIKFKRVAMIGNIMIALLTSMLFILGGVIVGEVSNILAIAGMAWVVTVGREITKDIEDMKGDFDRKTLPLVIGARNASLVAAICYIIGVTLSIQPAIEGIFNQLYLPVVLVADAIFIYSALILFSNPYKGQKFAKTGMMVALLAFILGGF